MSSLHLFSELEERPAVSLPQGMPSGTPFRRRTLCISISVQVAILLLLTGHPFWAYILLALSLFVVARQWAEEARQGRKSRQLWLIAVLVVLVALLPWLGKRMIARGHGLFGMGDTVHERPARLLEHPGEQDRSSYIGIVLWPPPAKKIKLVTPPPRSSLSGEWNTSKPLVIPFDGPYWYFKAPDKRPSSHARVVHGKPTVVNIRSTDWHPLFMEAHQNLGSSIPINCCSKLDVTLMNADSSPGKIAIGIILTDSTSHDKPYQYLGERVITSSEEPNFSINRPPMEETLHFSILPVKLQRFNEITVIFLPAKERAFGGAKISIEQFKLIPR